MKKTGEKKEVKNLSGLEDGILIKAFLKGETDAFQVLFLKYRETISRLVFSILKDHSNVEDVVQEVFLSVYRNLHKFRGDAEFKTWVYRIGVNESLRYISRNKRMVQMPENIQDPSTLSTALIVFNQGESPEHILLEGEQKNTVQKALLTLKPQHRTILSLFYLEDLSVTEISKILEIPEGSVKSRLFYAREALKKTLAPVINQEQPSKGKDAHAL